MTPSDLFQAGRLQDAIEAQAQKLKAAPADQRARMFLFELLLFAGDLDRARKHLDILHYDEPRANAAVEQYRQALDGEAARRRVLRGGEQPRGLGVAPDHVRLRLEALTLLARGERAAAKKLLDEANDALPVLRGTLNGKPFEGFYDPDERFGTVLEVFGTGGSYCWVPLELVESITMNPPSAPRDVLLIPAQLVLRDGPSGDVLLPGLYPDSHADDRESVRLGRETDWIGGDDSPLLGVGGKLFMAGRDYMKFLDWRQLTLSPSNGTPAES